MSYGGYLYEPLEKNLPPVSWLFDQLSDNNGSEDGLSLLLSVAVNEQISEVTMPYSWHAKLMPIIKLMYMMAHSLISIRACAS